MNENRAGVTFLKDTFDLHNSQWVQSAAKRSGKRLPQNPLIRIQNYLNRFNEVISSSDPTVLDRKVQAVKLVLLDKFVTKIDDLPQNYWNLSDQIIRERGEQADWEALSSEEQEEKKRLVAQNQLMDQKESLARWIDFFASPQSSFMPDYFKYWVFTSVTKLKRYDKETGTYPKRDKGTAEMFPELNLSALSFILKKLQDHITGKKAEQYAYYLSEDQEKELNGMLYGKSFPKLYAFANELFQPIPDRLLEVTDGEWVKYPQGSDPLPLVSSIRGYGTGWCTTGENVAQSELMFGGFYCYYSRDEKGQPCIPRIAISMKGSSIYEISGITYGQNIDRYMNKVLEEKLAEFPDGEAYYKKKRDMSFLTEIDTKTKAGIALTTEELKFLYEVDEPIKGFGILPDPRIGELISRRNLAADIPVVFGCDRTGIAHTIDEINKATQVYIGPLAPKIFRKIPLHLKYIYTAFPEKKIAREDVLIGTDKEVATLETELRAKSLSIPRSVRHMAEELDFNGNSGRVSLLWLTPADLGFTSPTNLQELYEKAEEVGLDLCPPEAGIFLYAEHVRRQDNDHSFIAMPPLRNHENIPAIFRFEITPAGLELNNIDIHNRWPIKSRFAFQV